MRRLPLLVSAALVAVIGIDNAMAEPTGGPIDLRPVVAAPKKKTVRGIAVPLPRLRPAGTAFIAATTDDIHTGTIRAPSGEATPPLVEEPPQPTDSFVGSFFGSLFGSSDSTEPPPAGPEAAAPVDVPKADALPSAPVRDAGSTHREPVEEPPLAEDGFPPALRPTSPLRLVGQPYELVRTLQSLQDQIAQGSTDALVTQRSLRAEIDEAFAAANPKVWQDHRNAAAAVTYVLSGGSPSILRRLGDLNPPPAIDDRLIDGVLAYIEGKEPDANRLLGDIDVFDLPPSMGAQLALAQSALAVRSDPVKALRLLDTARLLAPGTLVEEAALRRELFVADRIKDDRKIESLARQYLSRFRHSVYAANFRNHFAAAISRMDLAKDTDQARRVGDMLAAMEPPARRQLYLVLAVAAVVKGKTATAMMAAENALSLSGGGSGDEARSRLYRAAAGLADPKSFDAAVADLGGVNRSLLSKSDDAFYEAVAATLEGIGSGTKRPAKAASAPAAQRAEPDTKLSPLLTRAADSIKAADTLLLAAK
jgi:chemotaxis protein MotC